MCAHGCYICGGERQHHWTGTKGWGSKEFDSKEVTEVFRKAMCLFFKVPETLVNIGKESSQN